MQADFSPAQQARTIANTRAITLRECVRERSVRIGRLTVLTCHLTLYSNSSKFSTLYTATFPLIISRPTAWTAWDDFPHAAETEATCIWKVSLQIVVEISNSLCYECQVRGSFCDRS